MGQLFKMFLFFGMVCIGTEGLGVDSKSVFGGIVIETNGVAVLVPSQRVHKVVWGDRIIVKDAILDVGKVKNPVTVNFVGFPNRDYQRPAEDRGLLIRSDRDLLTSWSVDGKGLKYRVKVSAKDLVYGYIDVEILPPRLQYVVVSINNEEKVLREGDILNVQGSDRFKIKHFETNIEVLDSSVRYRIVPDQHSRPNLEDTAPLKSYELLFYRYNREFARIPIRIRGG